MSISGELTVSRRQLNNEQFYNKVNEDPTEGINKRVRFYFKRLLADGVRDKETHQYLTPEDPKAGRFYILPKIHKDPPSQQT